MPINSVEIQFVEGARAAAPASAANVVASLGACSSGTVGTLYGFRSFKALTDTLGVGPLVSKAAADIESAGIAYAMRVTGAAGAQASWTQTGSGPAVENTGTPLERYRVRVKIVAGGLRGTATFRVSFDGGRTYGSTLVTAATYAGYASATGLTLTFATGTYVAGEVYSSDSTPPYYSSSDALDALDLLLADPREWGMVHLVGAPADENDLSSLAGSVGTAMADAEANLHRYSRVLLEAPGDVVDADLIAEFAAFADARVLIAAGECEFANVIDKRDYVRNIAWEYSGRIAKIPISMHPGQVDGGRMLSRVKSLYRDEAATPGLDEARFITARTIVGAQGFYFTRGRTMAGSGSDYGAHQICRVADEAARAGRAGLLRYLNKGVELDPETGFILEGEAADIDSNVGSAVASALRGHATGVTFSTTRDDNLSLQAEPELTGEISFVPKGYLEHITYTIGVRRAA